jgi:hypothetical protein
LPSGKKPLIITQTQVNYYYYMTDSNGDKIPDAKGAGFASKLIVDENGKLTNTYIDASGNQQVGAYDMVPILESFVESHPDFSYRGAKAVLAITGFDGIFGYRTYEGAADTFGQDAYDAEVSDAKKLVDALRKAGYEIACYTYANIGYGSSSANQIKADLKKWNNEVAPIVGDLRTFVFAQNSDIGSRNTPYSGQAFSDLRLNDFSIFLGFANTDGSTWSYEGEQYVRMGRIMVSGSNMAHNRTWFDGIFDPANYRMNGADCMEGINATLKNLKYLHIKDAIYESQTIVPAGEGEGQIARVINMVNEHTDDVVYLTLEPHLHVFDAYASIDEHELKGTHKFTSNREAFDFAACALKKLLTDNGYRRNGENLWIK